MSGFDTTLVSTAIYLGIFAGLALLLRFAWLAANRWLANSSRINDLERELSVYVEASTRVAQTLEEILLARVRPGESVHSSRRYLLTQARDRLSHGEPLQTVARNLGLSFDESRLLERSSR
jgi:hypothetical protein